MQIPRDKYVLGKSKLISAWKIFTSTVCLKQIFAPCAAFKAVLLL